MAQTDGNWGGGVLLAALIGEAPTPAPGGGWDAGDWSPLVVAVIAIGVSVILYRRQRSDTTTAMQRRDQLEAHRTLLAEIQRATDVLGPFTYGVLTKDEIDDLNLNSLANTLNDAGNDARFTDSDRQSLQMPISHIEMLVSGIDTISPPNVEDIEFALRRSDVAMQAQEMHRVAMKFVRAAHYQRRKVGNAESQLKAVRQLVERRITTLGG